MCYSTRHLVTFLRVLNAPWQCDRSASVYEDTWLWCLLCRLHQLVVLHGVPGPRTLAPVKFTTSVDIAQAVSRMVRAITDRDNSSGASSSQISDTNFWWCLILLVSVLKVTTLFYRTVQVQAVNLLDSNWIRDDADIRVMSLHEQCSKGLMRHRRSVLQR